MLTRVRTHNDMIGWIKFFLEAVIETSKTAKTTKPAKTSSAKKAAKPAKTTRKKHEEA